MCECRPELCDCSLMGAVWLQLGGSGLAASSHVLRCERPLPGGGDGQQKGTDSEYFGVN